MIDICCNLVHNILTLLLYTHGVLHFFIQKLHTKIKISIHLALRVVQVIQNH